MTQRPDLDDLDLQDASCLWLEIHIGLKSVLVGTYYRPPGQLSNKRYYFMESLNKSITHAVELNPSLLILLGDFNDRCQKCDSVHSDSDNNGLKQIIDVPTRINDITESLLDLIIVDSEELVVNSDNLPNVGTSEHCMVYCHVNFNTASSSSYKREIWDFNHADYAGLGTALHATLFNEVFDMYEGTDTIAEQWMSLFKSKISKFIPYRSMRIHSRDKPWVTPELRCLFRKRHCLWRQFRQTGDPIHYQIY